MKNWPHFDVEDEKQALNNFCEQEREVDMGHDEATGPNIGMDNLNTIDQSGAGETQD